MIFTLLALLNGILISFSRVLNGRLATHKSAFYASWINHLGGFVFIALILLFGQGFSAPLLSIPWYVYMGGVIGGLYVGLNSYVVPRLGVTLATLLVIAGQLVVSLLVDVFLGKLVFSFSWSGLQLILGAALIVCGFYLLRESKKPK